MVLFVALVDCTGLTAAWSVLQTVHSAHLISIVQNVKVDISVVHVNINAQMAAKPINATNAEVCVVVVWTIMLVNTVVHTEYTEATVV